MDDQNMQGMPADASTEEEKKEEGAEGMEEGSTEEGPSEEAQA